LSAERGGRLYLEKKALKIADSGEVNKLNANLHRLFYRV
jgi:hypothetical protein